jgi:hypothetical protein
MCAECRAGERLRVQMLVPKLPLGGSVVPAFAVVAQSLPYSADMQKLPFALPAGFSAVVATPPAQLTAPVGCADARALLPGADHRHASTLVGGRAYIVVWSPHNHMGKYALQVGQRWPLQWTLLGADSRSIGGDPRLVWSEPRRAGGRRRWRLLLSVLAHGVAAARSPRLRLRSNVLGRLAQCSPPVIGSPNEITRRFRSVENDMRIILYLGKGGVGKTTTAAASAIRSADLGYRTLVVSTDIATAWPTAWMCRCTPSRWNCPQPLRPGDQRAGRGARALGRDAGLSGQHLAQTGHEQGRLEEMAIIPGMEEVVSLLHINKQAREGHFDCVIVDAAPTGETMRLLTMPESFQWYVGVCAAGATPRSSSPAGCSPACAGQRLFTGLNKLVEGVKELQTGADRPDGNQLSHRAQPREDGAQGRRARRHLSLALWLPGGRRHRQPHPAGCGKRRRRWRQRRPTEQRRLSAPPAGDPGALPGRDRTRLLPAARSCARAGTTRRWWA